MGSSKANPKPPGSQALCGCGTDGVVKEKSWKKKARFSRGKPVRAGR